MSVILYKMQWDLSIYEEEWDRVTDQFAIRGKRREGLQANGWFKTREDLIRHHRDIKRSQASSYQRLLDAAMASLAKFNEKYPEEATA